MSVAAGLGLALPGRLEPTLRFHARRQADLPLGESIQEFALDMSSNMWDLPGNVVVSPLSITTLLTMLLMGTSGTTYHELRNALQYPTTEDRTLHQSFGNLLRRLVRDNPALTVNVANRLYVQNGISILANFSNDVSNYYGSSVRQLDFARNPNSATATINSWVNRETRGQIPSLLDTVDPRTSILAVNTLYFKGNWATPFNEQLTSPDIFNTGTHNISVPMMRAMMKVQYVNMEDANAEMIALPYEGHEFAMYFIVPKGPASVNSLLELEFYLDANTLNRHIDNMQTTQMNVMVPKMKLRYKTDLADVLKRLEVTRLFDGGLADFSRMTTAKAAVDRVIHETVIDINEKFTEASAATATDLNRIGSSRVFLVNKVALLAIIHNPTRTPLFWGRVINPLSS